MSVTDVLANRRQWTVAQGDCLDLLREMPDGCVQAICTSPPYWSLRDYQVQGQLGLESVPDCLGWATGAPCGECYVCHLVAVFAEARRVLRPDGVCFLNVGDSYVTGSAGGTQGTNGQRASRTHTATGSGGRIPAGLKAKDLTLIPFRLALALQSDGWYVRSDIAWCKRAPMPESVTDRPTSAWEHIFLLTRSARYFYDAEAVREQMTEAGIERYRYAYGGAKNTELVEANKEGVGVRTRMIGSREPNPAGRNLWNYWLLSPEPYPESHFATFPTEIPRRCILAGSRPGDVVLDPFAGSGTTILTALRHDRRAIGLELNPAYVELANRRIVNDAPLFNATEVPA